MQTLCGEEKPLKRYGAEVVETTGLKAGVNDKKASTWQLALINTGFQAGDLTHLYIEAVLTASLVLPTQPVAINELLELLAECARAMVFLLLSNVLSYPIHI